MTSIGRRRIKIRCECCNVILTNQEATRKFESGVFVDMCNTCLTTIDDGVSYVEGTSFDDEESYEE